MANTPEKFKRTQPVTAGRVDAQRPSLRANDRKVTALLKDLEETKLEEEDNGLALAVRFHSTADGTYRAEETDQIILVDAQSGAGSVLLPNPIGKTGRLFTVKRLNNVGGSVGVSVTGGTHNIDNDATKSLDTQYAFITCVAFEDDAGHTGYWIIAQEGTVT